MKKHLLILILSLSALAIAGLGAMIFFFTPDLFQTPVKKIPIKNEFSRRTNLLPLHIKKIKRGVTGNGGGVASVGKNILVQKAGQFFHLDLTTQKLMRIDVDPPANGLEAIKNWQAYKFKSRRPSRYLKINPKFFNHKNILIIPRRKGTILLVAHIYLHAQDHCYALRLSRADFSADLPPLQWKATKDDWTTIFETRPCIQEEYHGTAYNPAESGGGLSLSKKLNHIILAIGTFGVYGSQKKDFLILQNEKSDYGSIVEININNGRKTKISTGHRNPQGLTLDDQGNLWAVEQGPQGGDELNLIVKGKNYGWPFVTYGTDYGAFSYSLSQAGQHQGYEKPIFAFVPSIAMSDVSFVRNFEPEWNGDLLVSSLRGRSLFRLRIRDGRVVVRERINLKERIRNIHNHGNGTLIASGSKNIFIIKTNINRPSFSLKSSDPAVRQAWNACIVCHGAGRASNGNAPSLLNVLKREIGNSDFAHYSQSFKAASGRWTEARLKAFLSNPDALFEDTSMPNPNIDDPKIITAIIEHLKTLKD